MEQPLTVPGIGQAGTMLCPIMKSPCWKEACMLWSELTYAAGTPDERKVGNCAITWIPIVTSEQTQAMNRMSKMLESVTPPITAANRNGKKKHDAVR